MAHADDEIIWPATYLLQGNNAELARLVLFHVASPTRQRESMALARALYIHETKLHDFPDCERGSDGLPMCPAMPPAMRQELQRELDSRQWQRVITHGPSGEYGHEQHKALHRAVVDHMTRQGTLDRLHVFNASATLAWPSDRPAYQERYRLLKLFYQSRGSFIDTTWGTRFESTVVPWAQFNASAARLACLAAAFPRNARNC